MQHSTGFADQDISGASCAVVRLRCCLRPSFTMLVTLTIATLPFLTYGQSWLPELVQQTTGLVYGSESDRTAVEHQVAGYNQDPLQSAPLIPQAVVVAADTSDVATAVTLARKNNLSISVRGGGHWAVSARAAGDITIDLSSMKAVEVDPLRHTLRAQGGANGGDMLDAAMPYGFGLPWGDASVTGMGLALGGGIGLAMRQHGLTCDSIIGAQLVVANGSMVTLTEDGPTDLLQGIRGAGAALGVVTELTFNLFDQIEDVYAGELILSNDNNLTNTRALLEFTHDALAAYPGLGIEVFILPGTGTPYPTLTMIQVNFFDNESMEEKEAVFDPLRALDPLTDLLGPSILEMAPNTTTEFNALNDYTGTSYKGVLNSPPIFYLSGLMSEEQLMGGGMEALLTAGVAMYAAANSSVFLSDWLGPATRHTDSYTAFSGAYMHFFFAIVGTADERSVAEELRTMLASHVTSFYPYPNLATDPDPACVLVGPRDLLALRQDALLGGNAMSVPGLATKVGGPDKLRQLQHLKYLVDPENFFVHHQLQGLAPMADIGSLM